jgi:predicted nucleic acid-binding protein
MYILDTNVVSELRKSDRADKNVVRWAQSVDASTLFISPITIMEIEIGILRLNKDKSQQEILRKWFEEQVLITFSERIIPIDQQVARACAQLHIPDSKSDRDALIAATGIAHQMTIVTRNIQDFNGTGVKLLNPWEPV